MRSVHLVGVGFALVFAGATVAGQVAREGTVRLAPDLVVYNGKIVTVDDPAINSSPGHIVQALAVRDHTIVATGTTADIRALAGATTRQIDLKGRTVVPGFVMTHEHPLDWIWMEPEALKHAVPPDSDYLMIRWLSGTAREQLASWDRVLGEMARQAKPGQWLLLSFTYGPDYEYSEELISEFPKAVTRSRLDQIAPNNPVRVKNNWVGGVLNTKGLEEARTVHKTPNADDPEAGLEGRPLEPDVIMKGRTDVLANIVKAELELWAAHGVTGFGSGVYSFNNLHAIMKLDRAGELPTRWGWTYNGENFDEDTVRYFTGLLGTGSDYLFNIGIWKSAGGNCTTLEAAPAVKAKECCSFAPGTPGREVLERIIRNGGRIATMHSGGDKDIDYLMDAIEKASKEAGLTPAQVAAKRHAFDHSSGAPRPDQLPRIKRLGMMVSMLNTMLWENRTDYDTSFRVRSYGTEAANWSVPRKSVLDAGVMNTFEIDRPMPHKTFYFIWVGMTRYNEKEKRTYAPQQGTDRIVQLKALTTWASYYLLREQRLGSLEPGKLADFIVLDRDYLAIPEADIPKVRVLMTVLGGKTIHLMPELAQEIGAQPVGPVTWPTRPLQNYFARPELTAEARP